MFSAVGSCILMYSCLVIGH
uniref:Uncharacterized protein n=1 Tax=Anguilla anguilla TaxID=7936 RepID=A0A0E9TVF2_ANGAN